MKQIYNGLQLKVAVRDDAQVSGTDGVLPEERSVSSLPLTLGFLSPEKYRQEKSCPLTSSGPCFSFRSFPRF